MSIYSESIVIVGLCIFLMCAVLAIFILSTVKDMTGESRIVQTDCYDRDNNKINDLTCDKEIRCNHLISWLDDPECNVKNQNGGTS